MHQLGRGCPTIVLKGALDFVLSCQLKPYQSYGTISSTSVLDNILIITSIEHLSSARQISQVGAHTLLSSNNSLQFFSSSDI